MGETADIQYFAKQRAIYPKQVKGRYRRLKWIVMVITLGIYYLTPFLRWDRGPHAPDQAILIDMPHRRAYFFFIEIWPQEVYYLTGILILAAISLFFVTSLFGRVWCGYTCPQTVWTDLFIHVERFIQGDRNARMRLDNGKLTLEKIWKKGLTHFLWLVIAMCTGGAWVLYFNDAPTLLEQIAHFDVPWGVLGWIIALTFSTYLMAGYAREQVCIYMCPYARFQSAMFDEDTLVIDYDKARGEPRGKHKKGESWEGRGDCVDCTACVQVCPMGIDIRNGLQMECIACGLCVDACNDIMDKVERPQGLIRYDTVRNQRNRAEGKEEVVRLIRPRTIYYSAIIAIVGSIMLFGLINRSSLELHVYHDRNPLFVTLSSGKIRNGYDIKILNKTYEDKHYRLSVEGVDAAELTAQEIDAYSTDNLPVYADSVGHFRIFLVADKQANIRHEITFRLEETGSSTTDTYDSVFMSGNP
ncbi:MAG: cytochrome c oxidase accessory protein CcoG [Rickettsiales bacterium]